MHCIRNIEITHLQDIKMTVDDLKHIFRFQIIADTDYTPKDTVEYMLIEGQTRITRSHDALELDSLIILLDNFQFEGYKDRVPVFLKPDIHVLL